MTGLQAELHSIVSELASELTSSPVGLTARNTRVLAWALKDTMEALRVLSPTLAMAFEEGGHANETWAEEIANLEPSQAKGVSDALSKFSARVTSLYMSQELPSSSREALRDAVGFLYADVLRPLWKAYPSLKPVEMS